jgi:hypothetical protein
VAIEAFFTILAPDGASKKARNVLGNQKPYEEIRHQLDTAMLQASTLKTEIEQRGFVNQHFTRLHKARQENRINQGEYIKLLNRLAAYGGGKFNDYLDMLAGAAALGVLELAIQGELSQLTPEAARERGQVITDLTGMKPAQPDEEP